MLKILLISDTHSHCEPNLIEYLKWADEVWHAGDWGSPVVSDWISSYTAKIRGVHGNIDSQDIRQIYAQDLRWQCEGFDIMMTHIGGYPGKYAPRVKKILDNNSPNLFICGHSHIVKAEKDNQYDMWTLNPGACGAEGFHQIKTAIKFCISDGNLTDFELINLGTRSNKSKL